MACETMRKPKQTLQERISEVQQAITLLDAKLKKRLIKPVVDKATGAIAFPGWDAKDRNGITDACAYRRIMATGSVLARQEIAAAEQRAGRTVNRQALAAGIHSHDGGGTWGRH
jgi:hypothetical protein